MATKRKIPLNRISGGDAVGTATFDLPTNVRYHGIGFEYATDTVGGSTRATMEAQIGDFTVNIDEVAQRKFSSKQLFDINASKGRTPTVGDGTAPGYLPLFFSEPQRESQIERESTAWGMAGVGDFQIEVDIKDAGQAPKLKAFAIVDDVQEAPIGIVKWKRGTLQVSEIGDVPFILNTEKGDSYQGIYFFEQATNDISSLLLEWDGVKINHLTKYQQTAYMKQFADGFTEVAKMLHVPLDGNHPADALRSVKKINGKAVAVQELIATLGMATSNNVTVIRELVGLPD